MCLKPWKESGRSIKKVILFIKHYGLASGCTHYTHFIPISRDSTVVQLSPAQYHTLHSELTGDCSVTDNCNSKAVDERIKLVIKIADESILRDIRVKRDLYEWCCNAAKENNLSYDNILSLSWFRFQFSLKHPINTQP